MTALADHPTSTAVRGRADALTGTGALIRFMLRRDRVRIPAWVAGLAGSTVMIAGNFTQLYPTAAERLALAATLDSPAGVAMTGVNHAPNDYGYGVMMAHQMLWFTAILIGLMSVLLLVRHTRTEEATGRAELVRAAVVGRHAHLAAALAVVAVANLAVGLLMAVGLGASGIDGISWTGSWLYGAAHVAVGVVFAAVAAVTVQVSEHSRGASGLGMAAVGLAYALRALGDVGNGALSWLSPIGWAQATRVYVDDRWWPLLVALVAAGTLVAVAVVLSTRRDVGAGLRQPRPGPAVASGITGTPLGFAFRLHRANLLAWAAGMLLLGVMYGSVLGEAEQWLTDIEAMGDMLPQVAGAGVTETFAAMVTTVMAIIASAYAVLAAQRMRTEETAGRADPLLVAGLARARYVASHAAVALGGSTLVILAAGLGIGLASAAAMGDATWLWRLLGAALAHAPALWVVAGVVVALFGLAPRAAPLAWVVVGYSFVVVYLGGLLQLPHWMANLSPFGHVGRLPAADLEVLPLLVLTALAGGLVAAGLAAFGRRDLQSPA
jgi:ABC-2 type transport system permease protein